MDTNPTFEQLRTRLAEIEDVRRSLSILYWDQQTMMPPAGAAIRADGLATLSRMAHELFVAPETGRLLDELAAYEDSLDPESDEASLIRVTRVDYEKAVRVPPALRAEMSRAASEGYMVWQKAKPENDFASYLPVLERNVDLRLRYVECFDPRDETYDVLLDDYERGMTTAEVRAVFDELKDELVPLIAAVRETDDDSIDACLRGDFAVEAQERISKEVTNLFGYREGTWRLDPTHHPFASGAGVDDLRITTNYHPGDIESLFATMHEYGHGLYEHQVDAALDRTPLGTGVSLGLHESQSRMWENLVGRSRPFWRFFYPRLQARFAAQLGDVDLEAWYRTINRVQPSLIRIKADEITYNMHIILRFELEQDLLSGSVPIGDLPSIWSERMHEYLGIDVPDNEHGVLQDMHWALGTIGYFSTYSLGNIMSVQIWERILEEIPDLEDQIERGDFAALREWLGERIHRHGRKFDPQETLERAVGSRIDPEPYLRYLRAKHGAAALA
jgi:carboxypeptidase Taq